MSSYVVLCLMSSYYGVLCHRHLMSSHVVIIFMSSNVVLCFCRLMSSSCRLMLFYGILSSYVIVVVLCYLAMSSSYVVLYCHNRMTSYVIVVVLCHLMSSSSHVIAIILWRLVVVPYRLMLSSSFYYYYKATYLCAAKVNHIGESEARFSRS